MIEGSVSVILVGLGAIFWLALALITGDTGWTIPAMLFSMALGALGIEYLH